MRNYGLGLVVRAALTPPLLRDSFLWDSHFLISLAAQCPEDIPWGIRLLIGALAFVFV